MSDVLPLSPSATVEILKTINLGLIVVNAKQHVVLWNGWVEKHSGISADEAQGLHINAAFEDAPTRAFLTALGNTLNYGLPVVLSNALHRFPLDLFEQADEAGEKKRLHQSITLTPLSVEGERWCLVQISDSSASIKREKILRTHSEILKKEATTDSLTGIYNRRFFDEHYKIALANAIRQNNPLAVFMIDIDFFKDYNDHYGHVAGDKALVQVATGLKSQLVRASDAIARFGGEEFIVIMPDMSKEGAIQFAEKIRAAVANLAIRHEKSPISEHVSISIGYSNFSNADGSDPSLLLKTADAALYAAKNNGRNKAIFLKLPQLPQTADNMKQAQSKNNAA